jgi:hypothetical protein
MAYDHNLTLLSNASATGAAVAWGGGKAMLTLEGTISGATVSLQVQTLTTGTPVWATVTSRTTLGAEVVELPAGNVRALVASGTPSALYAYLVKVPQ